MSRPAFLVITAVIVFLYFELQWQLWFVRLLNGYLVKVWLPPFLLLWAMVLRKLMTSRSGSKQTLTTNPILTASLCLYALFGFASMCLNETLYFAIKYYLIIVNPVVLFMVIVEQFRDNRDIETFLKVLFLCGLIQASYSVYTFETWLAAGQPPREGVVTNKGNVLGGPDTAVFYSPYHRANFPRFTDFSFEQGKFAAILFPLVVLGLSYGLGSRRLTRYGYWGVSLFVGYLIVATISRGAILASMLGLGVFFWWMVKCRLAKWRLIAAVVALAALYTILSDSTFFFRILSLLASVPGISSMPFLRGVLDAYHIPIQMDPHVLSVFTTLEHVQQHPIFGVGYTGMRFGETIDTPELNRYLAILGSSGLATAVPYLVFVLSLIVISWRTIGKLYRHHRPGVELGIVLLTCISMFAIKLNNEGQESLYYWVFFALTAAWIRNSRRFIEPARTESRHAPGETRPRGLARRTVYYGVVREFRG
ncbi:MAG: hypothetical protein HY207_08920 [Nitrospirae bacterium]|nr:hypothetical protein [Nitrospirota bacterium]